MALRHLTLSAIALGVAVAASGPLVAQKGKPAPAADRPGTLTFSCTASDFTNVFCPDGDRIVGDSRNYAAIGSPETGQGAFLRGSNNNLWLGFGAGLYKLQIDFNERAPGDVPSCTVNNSCRLNETRFPANLMLVDVEDGEIQSTVVTGPGGAELPDGLMAMAPGESGAARAKINFTDPLDGSLWVVRFNPNEYAGSNELPVTRVDACTWRFESDGDDDDLNGVVEPLAGVPGLYDKRTKTRYDEGLFVLRFSMTLRVPSLCQ